jgi:cysteinyl-tRNA synthetase
LGGVVLYNTRTRKKETFTPLEPGKVSIYSCGPTVYSAQHVGNLRPYLYVDLLKRTLLEEGYAVRHVINITDVGHLTSDSDTGDDKMELAVQRTGRSAADIAEEFTQKWLQDLRWVNCLEPDVYCKATEHIPEQIALAERLDEKGFLYRTEDGVYFDTSKFPAYAEFARLDLAGQTESGRIEPGNEKRNAADFAVWKFAAPGVKRQQEWDSPWGRGFPGWHLECSAMSSKYLGEHFDIHTGGIDHIPVHHTNEIAQSECAFDVHPWVNVWMHNAFYDFGGDKMSKSLGNIALLSDFVEKGIEPLAFRYFFLQAAYRQPQSFTEEALEAAAVGYRRLLGNAMEFREAPGEGDPARQAPYRERFRDAMRDDLNAPRAMAVLWEIARSADSELAPADKRDLLIAFDQILGLDLLTAVPPSQISESDPRIDELLEQRQQARQNKDFATADRIRDELAGEGIEIVDTPDGPKWRRT